MLQHVKGEVVAATRGPQRDQQEQDGLQPRRVSQQKSRGRDRNDEKENRLELQDARVFKVLGHGKSVEDNPDGRLPSGCVTVTAAVPPADVGESASML